MEKDLICVAKIFAAHGIKGAVKIKSFTENPLSIAEYLPLLSKDASQEYVLKIQSCNEDIVVAKIEGVNDRNDAEMLRGRELYANRQHFGGIDEDEFFYEDLVGLRAKLQNGKEYGEVVSIQNYGAGDIIEIKIKEDSKTDLFSFTKALFPVVNVKGGYVVIVPPEIENVE